MVNPDNVEEAMRQYRELRSKNEEKQERDLHARVSLSGGIEVDPISKQVLRRSLYPKIEIDVPPDAPDCLEALHRAQATINILIGEFMAAHLLKPQDSKKPEQKPTLPYGINQIEWWPNKFPENIPPEKRGEYTSTDRPECAELRKLLENAGKAIEIEGQSYSLNTARTYVYRKPVGVK